MYVYIYIYICIYTYTHDTHARHVDELFVFSPPGGKNYLTVQNTQLVHVHPSSFLQHKLEPYLHS